MAGEIQIDSVTALTASGSNIVLNNVNTATNRTNLGLGSIATQAANSVSITGGNITGGTIGSGVVFPAGGIGNAVSYALLYESYANNTSVNSSTGNQQRAINTEIYDADNLVSSISNGNFTLANAGTYLFEFYAEAYKTGGHQAYIKDVTNNNSVLAYGTVAYTGTSVSASTPSTGLGYHTITTSNTYGLWHYIKSGTTSGLGVNNNTGNLTCFSYVKITKLK